MGDFMTLVAWTGHVHIALSINDVCGVLPHTSMLPWFVGWQDVVLAAHLDRVDLSAHGFYATPDVTGFGGTMCGPPHSKSRHNTDSSYYLLATTSALHPSATATSAAVCTCHLIANAGSAVDARAISPSSAN